jgi:hypothetical protein
MKTGHNGGTEGPENRTGRGSSDRSKDVKSFALAFTPRLFDIKSAAHYASLGAYTIRQLIWKGKLPTVKLPRLDGSGEPMDKVLILRDDLDTYLEGLPREYEPN